MDVIKKHSLLISLYAKSINPQAQGGHQRPCGGVSAASSGVRVMVEGGL
jgi:hypothetical protein